MFQGILNAQQCYVIKKFDVERSNPNFVHNQHLFCLKILEDSRVVQVENDTSIPSQPMEQSVMEFTNLDQLRNQQVMSGAIINFMGVVHTVFGSNTHLDANSNKRR